MLRRRDVETSRRYRWWTFILVDPTSRRWGVTTCGRHDVGTSRRSSHLMHFHPLLQTASKNCPFRTNFTYIHTNCTNQILSYKNTYLNVKLRKNVRQTRVQPECFRHSSPILPSPYKTTLALFYPLTQSESEVARSSQ